MKLITDRTQANVNRCRYLTSKGKAGMSAEEWAEYTGDPSLSDLIDYDEPVNLLGGVVSTSSSVGAIFMDGMVRVSVATAGTHRYGVSIIGPAEHFENKSLTLSVGAIRTNRGTATVIPTWYDEDGSRSPISGSLGAEGSMTFHTGANTNGRAYLALYFYATTSTSATVGTYVEYHDVMLEFGDTAHSYVPYTPILPTSATKGAYNFTDLNRVESVVAEISAALGMGLETKTDWTEYDKPNYLDMDRYIGNIQSLRERAVVSSGTPDAPSTMSKLGYAVANDIEKILYDIRENIANSFRSGELYAGEV